MINLYGRFLIAAGAREHCPWKIVENKFFTVNSFDVLTISLNLFGKLVKY